MKPVRNSAKALIVENGQILVIRNTDPWGDYYLLPGGGQRPGETLVETLQRECREEIGVAVEVGDLVYIREYIGAHHEFYAIDGDDHQVEFIFACRLPPGTNPHMGEVPDNRQVGVLWLPQERIREVRFYPLDLRLDLISAQPPIYRGDIN